MLEIRPSRKNVIEIAGSGSAQGEVTGFSLGVRGRGEVVGARPWMRSGQSSTTRPELFDQAVDLLMELDDIQ